MGKLSAKVLVSHRFNQIVSFGCISVMRMNIAQNSICSINSWFCTHVCSAIESENAVVLAYKMRFWYAIF
jgi:hypothetical protein